MSLDLRRAVYMPCGLAFSGMAVAEIIPNSRQRLALVGYLDPRVTSSIHTASSPNTLCSK
uniref:Uncharacterized protein n=1 Tax=Kwoniella pini CBS 10737 TaxID=1296096 RepID=A0A1B9I926_9TREE|nr:uncharacterized protein I206_01267 [Kwoniella pini CBS 10737]OCF51983.1 hypothetical protein I206_01267 [Kwoniella pini CBS 10737]